MKYNVTYHVAKCYTKWHLGWFLVLLFIWLGRKPSKLYHVFDKTLELFQTKYPSLSMSVFPSQKYFEYVCISYFILNNDFPKNLNNFKPENNFFVFENLSIFLGAVAALINKIFTGSTCCKNEIAACCWSLFIVSTRMAPLFKQYWKIRYICS